MRFVVLYIFIAAALLRLIGLDQSFWLDEAITARVVDTLSFWQIVTDFSPSDFHPPLYYLFLDLWALIFGVSEVSLRIPSILFAIIAAWYIYRMMQKKEGITAALTAVGLFLLNPLVLYYSKEARMYLMVTMFLAILLFAIDRILSERGARSEGAELSPKRLSYYLYANAAIALSIWTFYGSLLMIAAVFLLFIAKRRWRQLLALTPGPVIALVAVAPLMFQQLQNAGVALAQVANWDLVLGTVTLKNLLLIPVKLVIGRISWDPQWFYLLSAGLLTAAIWYLAWRGTRQYKRMRIYLIVPVTLGIMVSFWFPMLQYFRFIYLAVPLSIALAYAVKDYPILRGSILSIFLVCILVVQINPAFQREDWKHLLISVPAEQPVYIIHDVSDPISYYYPDHPTIDLRQLEPGAPLEQIDPTIPFRGTTADTLVVIPYAAPIFGVPYDQYLTERGFVLDQQADYNGVLLQFWERNEVAP